MKTHLLTKWLSVARPLAAMLALCGATAANATLINFDNLAPSSIPAVATSTTTGADMSGMTVQVLFFGNSTSETLTWGTTGIGAGGVSGTNWGLTVSGNTFDVDWVFTNSTQSNLLRLVLNGAPGLTLFDTFFGGAFGTSNSSRGIDFDGSDDASGNDVGGTATYSVPVKLDAATDPLYDLYHVLTVDFGRVGLAGNWTFSQDTDNDARRTTNGVPEPSIVALMSLGLLGLGFARRFSRNS